MSVKKVDPAHLRPYGDQMDDGKVQLSFTLPVPNNAKGREAAKQFMNNLGFSEVQIVFTEDLRESFTMFVAYGKTDKSVDYTAIKVLEVETPKMDFDRVNDYVEKNVGRPITVVGATIGSDAHTIGLDAILNMKGFHGDSGLERYRMFKVHNMGSQVPPIELVRKAKEIDADVVLVSQIVTQRNVHINHLTELVDILEAEGIRDRVILVVGGPRITHELAVELGYDVGFGASTMPCDVASYLAVEMGKRA